jgi:hypothetical protein
MQLLWKIEDCIEVLGGTAAVARLTDKSMSHVSNWKRDYGRFPPKYYRIIQMALDERGYVASDDVYGFVGHFNKSA